MSASNASGLKVLLMTDLVGSVQLQQRLGLEAYSELKAQHDALVTELVRDVPSGEILEQTGDGFFIVFANVKDALRAALMLQSRIAQGDWPHERPQVRIGVHLGEVTPTVDQATGHARYAGINVSLTARIMDLAAGGQILVSGPVYENGEGTVRSHPPMEAGLPPPALRWKAHGRYAFKGLKERAQIYEIGGEGIATFKTPQGGAKARRADSLASLPVWLGVAVGLAVLAGAAFFISRETGRGETAPTAPVANSAARAAGAITIAVLPFSNFDGGENASFAAGMHEDILTTLAQLSQLQVISRTSVRGYLETVKNIRQIGQELGATHLVEGSIRRAGNRVRVTVQLIEAATDRHLWAEQFDRELQDVFAIQSEIATRIATELLDRLSPEQAAKLDRRSTENVEAYDAYNRAREIWRSRSNVTVELHQRVVNELEQATLLDPSFAEAWSLLSQIYSNWVFNALEPNNVHRESARFALRQVQRLAPETTEAYLAEAYFHYWANRDFDTALSPLVKARLQSPNDAEILMAEAYILRRKGRFSDSVQLLEQAIRLDPLNRALFDDFVTFLSILADYDRAEAQLRLAFERFPDDGAVHRNHALVRFLRDPTPANRDALATVVAAHPLDQAAVFSGEPFTLTTVLGDLEAGFRLFEEAANDPDLPPNGPAATLSGMMVFGHLLGRDEIARTNARLLLRELEAIPPEAMNRIAQLRHIEGIARRILGEPFDAREVASAVDAALVEAEDAFLLASSHMGRIALWSVADLDHAVQLFLEGMPYPGVQDQLPNAVLFGGLMPEFFLHPRIQALLAERPAWQAFLDEIQPELRRFGP